MTAVEHIDGRREGRVASHNAATHLIAPEAAGPWLVLAEALAGLEGDPPCAADPDRWFAAGALQLEEVEAAVHGCRRCPAADACAAYASAAGEREGTWGGVTAAERDAERRAARAARAAKRRGAA